MAAPDELEALADRIDQDELRLEDDLTIMVRRLARALRKADPGNELPDKAIDLLQRIGGLGSPMKAVVTMGDNSKPDLKKGP